MATSLVAYVIRKGEPDCSSPWAIERKLYTI